MSHSCIKRATNSKIRNQGDPVTEHQDKRPLLVQYLPSLLQSTATVCAVEDLESRKVTSKRPIREWIDMENRPSAAVLQEDQNQWKMKRSSTETR